MNRTRLWIFSTSCLLAAATASCQKKTQSTSAAKSEPASVGLSAEGDVFRCSSDEIPAPFLAFAGEKGVSEDVARSLYVKAMELKGNKDPTTGFDVAVERMPTLYKAVEAVRKGAFGYYVEADIHNLGGLNSVLGNSKADIVFRQMAESVHARLKKVMGAAEGGVVCPVRHGGDEFAFILVAKKPFDENALFAAVAEARTHIEDTMRRYDIRDLPSRGDADCLARILHPKHKEEDTKDKYRGTGVYVGYQRIPNLPERSVPEAHEDTVRRLILSPTDGLINAGKKSPVSSGECALTSR